MTNTESPAPSTSFHDAIVEEARELGAEHGKAAGSWVFDGNTDEATLRECLRMDEEGDPEFDDHWGSLDPLSGEWADGLTPETLFDELDIEREGCEESLSEWVREEIETAYEEGFRDAHRDEVLRSASAAL